MKHICKKTRMPPMPSLKIIKKSTIRRKENFQKWMTKLEIMARKQDYYEKSVQNLRSNRGKFNLEIKF